MCFILFCDLLSLDRVYSSEQSNKCAQRQSEMLHTHRYSGPLQPRRIQSRIPDPDHAECTPLRGFLLPCPA